ncbi:MAG: DUF1351 domain-containing protein [Firmicutes bacterium]|nr:DUF1351 domain-containing protein [Bacillota bacterium]
MTEVIKVTQLPVIEEQLRGVKADVERQVAEAKSLVCTPETIQTVKGVRAGLRKQFQALEDQRQVVKKAILTPYQSFEVVYKTCVSDLFREADDDLKEKIGTVEGEIKARCEERLRTYFAELCAARGLDFLRYEQAGVTVDMTSAKAKNPTKLMDKLAVFVERVAGDMAMIQNLEDAPEILAEYKQSLNAAGAVETVRARRQRVELERAAEEARRVERARQQQAEEAVLAAASQPEDAPLQAPEVLPAEPPERVEPEQEPEEIYQCTFTVQATKPQLRKLKAFLESEEIPYE